MFENCTCELGIVFKKCSMGQLRLEKNWKLSLRSEHHELVSVWSDASGKEWTLFHGFMYRFQVGFSGFVVPMLTWQDKCLMTTYSISQRGCCMDGFWLVDKGTHLLGPWGSNSTPNWKIEFVGLKLFLLVKCHPFYPDDSHHREITTSFWWAWDAPYLKAANQSVLPETLLKRSQGKTMYSFQK